MTDRATTSGRVGRFLSQDLFSTDPVAQREFLERLIARGELPNNNASQGLAVWPVDMVAPPASSVAF